MRGVCFDVAGICSVEFFDTLSAIRFVELLLATAEESSRPIFLFVLVLYVFSEELSPILPCHTYIFPFLCAGIFENRFAEGQICVGKEEFLHIFLLIYFSLESASDFFQRTFFVSEPFDPLIVLHLAGSLCGEVESYVFFNFIFWVFNALDTESDEAAGTGCVAGFVKFRTCAGVLAVFKAGHFTTDIGYNDFLEYEVCYSIGKILSEIKEFVALVGVWI